MKLQRRGQYQHGTEDDDGGSFSASTTATTATSPTMDRNNTSKRSCCYAPPFFCFAMTLISLMGVSQIPLPLSLPFSWSFLLNGKKRFQKGLRTWMTKTRNSSTNETETATEPSSAAAPIATTTDPIATTTATTAGANSSSSQIGIQDWRRFGADQLWTELLISAAIISAKHEEKDNLVIPNQLPQLQSPTTTSAIVMEVGVHNPKQCLEAARAGWETKCVEPSPPSFARVQNGLRRRANTTQQQLITLHRVAAGNTVNGTVEFKAQGGTGDHVGSAVDVWKMTIEDKNNNNNKDEKQQVTTVPVKRLDDLIPNDKHVYLLKIDTQGFEPAVFEGLQNVLSARPFRVSFIITEFHPKLMDLMASIGRKDIDRPLHEIPEERCKLALHILDNLQTHGYRLYALGTMAHPRAGRDWKQYIPTRPHHDLYQHCMWYYELEKKAVMDEEYKMGFWGDVLAVAPNAPALLRPDTLLFRELQKTKR